MTAMLVLGVTTTSVANAEDVPNSVEVTSFPFELSVMENGQIIFNNMNGTSTMRAVAYGWFEVAVPPEDLWIIELPIENCGTTCYKADDYFIRDLSTGEYSILHIVAPHVPEPIPATTGNGTMEVHVYEIPFDVTILEGGTVVYHNNDPIFHHDLQHTGTVGTEKGGTFNMWAEANGGRSISNFPIENCSSCYPAGVYSWQDSVSGITGTVTILENENTVNEQIGIQENVVVVLKKSEQIIQNNSTETADSVLDKTKNFKTQIEAKINAMIEPLRTEIENLKNDKLILDKQREKLTNQISILRQNVTISETKYLEESKINRDLQAKISTLESQAVDTIELEKYKKEAANWKSVALEQLRVMAEILGLF